MHDLKSTWVELTSAYSAEQAMAAACWAEIEKKHSARGRHYHNLSHLAYMVSLANVHLDKLAEPQTLLFSIFYHDIVYSATRQDNEQKSAEVAAERLAKLQVPHGQVAQCQKQIIATKAHELSSDNDTNFLLDFDLAILGDEPESYLEYTRKVRKEYAIYPDLLYKPGRKKVLRHFLEMEHIFNTAEFQISHEQQARENLNMELEQL